MFRKSEKNFFCFSKTHPENTSRAHVKRLSQKVFILFVQAWHFKRNHSQDAPRTESHPLLFHFFFVLFLIKTRLTKRNSFSCTRACFYERQRLLFSSGYILGEIFRCSIKNVQEKLFLLVKGVFIKKNQRKNGTAEDDFQCAVHPQSDSFWSVKVAQEEWRLFVKVVWDVLEMCFRDVF